MNEDCKRLAVDLSAYFDQELDGEDARKVEAHLADCPDCREDMEKMGRMRAALHVTAAPGAPQQRLLQDLMQTLRQPERQDGRELFDIGRGRPGATVTRGR